MTEVKENEVVTFDSKRPQLAEASPAPSMETLSHNWQPGSPAVDMRDGSSNIAGAINTVDVLAEQEKKTDEKAKSLSIPADEYKRRIALPVDDPQFINSSLDHIVSE